MKGEEVVKGAFQISREIFQNDIWNDPIKFRIFFYIIGNAVFSHEGYEIAGIHLKRGQYLRSLRHLQEDLSYSEGRGNAKKVYPLTTIRRKLKSLENDEQITMKKTEYGTLFTVVNYSLYQGLENYQNGSVAQKRHSNGTDVAQKRHNNKNVKEGIKNEENISSSNPHEFFQENIGVLKPIVSESISHWCNDLNDELVIAALKVTVKNGASSWNYTEAILKDWANHKLTTLDEVRAHEMQKKEKKQKQKRPYKSFNQPEPSVTPVPKWMKEPEQADPPSQEDEANLEKKRKEAAELREELKRRKQQRLG